MEHNGPEFNVEYHAAKIAENFSQRCGLPLLVVVPLVCSVLNVVINCWGQIIWQNQRTLDEGIDDFRASYAQRPKEVQRRLASRIFFSADPPVTAATAKTLADSMIEHAHDNANREPIKFFLGKSHEQQQ